MVIIRMIIITNDYEGLIGAGYYPKSFIQSFTLPAHNSVKLVLSSSFSKDGDRSTDAQRG